jgi:hypothetical protein
MQIFSNDKYSHLSSNNSTQNTKFQSPGKGHQVNGKMASHHQSASQQIENMMDLQQMRIRTNSGSNQTQKYTEYLNRFSTSQSIDQQQSAKNRMDDEKLFGSDSVPDQTSIEGHTA